MATMIVVSAVVGAGTATVITEVIGKAGPQGPRGLQGVQGVAGPQGPIGPIGKTGATGPVGPRGSRGPAATSGVSCVSGALVCGTGSQQQTVDLGEDILVSEDGTCPSGMFDAVSDLYVLEYFLNKYQPVAVKVCQ